MRSPTASGAWLRMLGEAGCVSKPLPEMRGPLPSLYAAWLDRRGARAFPSKADLVPKAVKSHLKHIAFVRLVDGGDDFEFRICGEALVQDLGENIQGRRLSAFADFGPAVASAFRSTACAGAANLFEIQHTLRDHRSVCGQVLLLPVGEHDGDVDHILAMGTVPAPADAAARPADELYDLGLRTFEFYAKPLEKMGDELKPLQALWEQRRTGRRFPTRHDIAARDIAQYLPRTTLMRVIDGGADFEYRLAGDVLIKSFGWNLRGARSSQLTNLRKHTNLDALMDIACRPVAANGMPILIEFKSQLYGGAVVRREALHLPLGDDDGAVDHILVASSRAVRS
jgi:hypothetical protein